MVTPPSLPPSLLVYRYSSAKAVFKLCKVLFVFIRTKDPEKLTC